MNTISLVVPVYSGEKFLLELVNQVVLLGKSLEEAGAPLQVKELILVDDSAIDGSPAIVDELARSTPWIRALHMSTNFGQHAATIAGILHSSGDWVVTLDEDLQHPPSAVPMLFRRVAQTQCDIVYARPIDGVHNAAIRDLTSRGFKHIMHWLSGNSLIRKANSFRLIRGDLARMASSVCAHDTYFDVALSWFSKRIETLKLPLKDTRYIETGKSGYRLRSLVSHARRMLISSQLKVLRLASLLGFIVLLASILAVMFLVVLKLVDPSAIAVRGWISLMLAVTFFGGLTMLMFGIVLEYVSILVVRSNGRPLFFTIDRSSDAELTDFFLRNTGSESFVRARPESGDEIVSSVARG